MRSGSMAVVYGLSVALHATLGFGVAEIEPAKEPKRIAVTVIQAPKPKPKEPPPAPPPVAAPVPAEAPAPVAAPKPKAAPARAKAPEAAPAAAPVVAAQSVPTFGIAMTGGVGQGGIAVPAGDGIGASGNGEAKKRVAAQKTLVQPKAEASGCGEPASKPKPLSLARPEYTDEARAAAIEGKVRVELTVDASGAVSQVKVLEGLGHGLDEAAVRAVQAASFEPAVQCGKPVSATFVVAIRFAL